MARVASNEITITDVTDGTNPVTAFTTNQNHTFAASSAGVVTDVAGFSSTLNVFVGQTQATYDSPLGTTPATFEITALAYVGTATGWGVPTNADAVVTIPSISDTATASVTLRVSFDVRITAAADAVSLTTDISLSIVKEGAGGQIVELTPNTQVFFADSAGVLESGQSNIIVGVETQGTTGNLTYATSLNGAAFVTQTATAATAGGIRFYDVDNTGDVDTEGTLPLTQNGIARLAFASSNLADANNTLAIRVTGATGGSDAITIFKVQSGATGTGAIIVSITSSDGVVFKNSAGTAKDITAVVTDVDTGVEPLTEITYTWTRAAGAAVHVTSATDRTVVTAPAGVEATGTAFTDITVGPEDVDTQERFGCSVSVADS